MKDYQCSLLAAQKTILQKEKCRGLVNFKTQMNQKEIYKIIATYKRRQEQLVERLMNFGIAYEDVQDIHQADVIEI
ncbi:unnamed protein product [Paramecium octaurelia]|uniref:Uncharacterized protein n=1 Tax=Paramecium octaurelia TaxID=43137 RepID=A0A8S1W1J0_PAROT|nr:unnamed protein product [Paramecium octaurelia]